MGKWNSASFCCVEFAFLLGTEIRIPHTFGANFFTPLKSFLCLWTSVERSRKNMTRLLSTTISFRRAAFITLSLSRYVKNFTKRVRGQIPSDPRSAEVFSPACRLARWLTVVLLPCQVPGAAISLRMYGHLHSPILRVIQPALGWSDVVGFPTLPAHCSMLITQLQL